MFGAIVDRVTVAGIFVADLFDLIVQAGRDTLLTMRQGRGPVLSVYFRQVYFTGMEAVRIILVTSLIIGTVVISQIVSIAGSGSEYLSGRVMVWVVVRELAPLLTAIIVIARSGTAVAAELSQMKIGGEIECIEALGIPTSHYLIMPRIWGMTTAMVFLTVYFAAGAVLGGFIVASAGWHVPLEQYSRGIFAVLSLWEISLSLAKGVVFGMVTAAICCRQGLKAGRSVTQIPQAATKAVMQSLFLVFILDAAMSVIFLSLT
ncbi:MAG: ABC transporter permease [Geobacter sp.]|nr:ABC transporter permease [Geobacter sp.]